jgi:TetR/AcrR family transcriptional repressor of nem operon
VVPRPREFDEREVLARAVRLFRQRGYHATSTRDLGDALGLNPSSLYRAFGDKHSLFLRALDRYQQSEAERAGAALSGAGPVRERLRDWLLSMLDGAPDAPDTGSFGCLVVNTASELGTSDPEAGRRVRTAFDNTTAALADVLHRAIEAGELPSHTDPDAAADLLFTTLTGLRVRQRSGESEASLRVTVNRAIRALG